MSSYTPREVQSLAFLTLASFIASFLIARTFTTLFPSTVVVTGGIHFHHFWYGLAMVEAAGFLAIVSNRPEYDRVYAIVFGLGAGLIGDEVGLLLTFGDYQSGLTYDFFVGILTMASLAYLVLRYREQLQRGVLSFEAHERLVHVGVFVTGVSALAWAFNLAYAGVGILLVGLLLLAIGLILRRARRRPPPHGQPSLLRGP